MISKILGVMGGGAMGAAFIAIGYFLFNNDPIQVGGRKGRMFMSIQDWFIETLGMTESGLLLIGFGVIGGFYAIYTALTDSDED